MLKERNFNMADEYVILDSYASNKLFVLRDQSYLEYFTYCVHS